LLGAGYCAILHEFRAYLNEIESYLMEIELKVVEFWKFGMMALYEKIENVPTAMHAVGTIVYSVNKLT